MSEAPYHIGTQGTPWGDTEKQLWLAEQKIQRSYAEQVQSRLQALAADDTWERCQYGALSYDADRFPLWGFTTASWRDDLPTVLITGGVHGYETSGVMGATQFMESNAQDYAERCNFVVLPCISPWGFETINRWNPLAIDPNRSFYADSPAEESAAVLALLAEGGWDFLMHIDLHETTDTDNTEFRRALAARNGEIADLWEIPDGFYTVGDVERPEPAFQTAVIAEVEPVTHIAPPDAEGRLIGVPLEQHGVINYAARELGLCAGITAARFVTTTEVYPDSPRVDDANCSDAQVAAIVGGLDYALAHA